jgi:preprotein translocase subunit SecA
MKKFFERIMGTYSDRELRRIMPIADKVDSYEEIMKGYTDSQLRGKTAEFKERLSKGETLDDILPAA